MKGNKLVIIGAGGFAREVAWLVHEINSIKPRTWDLIGFWDNDESNFGRRINGVAVIGTRDVLSHLPDLQVVSAIGNPIIKERATSEAKNLGCNFATLVHPSVQYDQSTVRFGTGCIICAGNILTVNIDIGAHVILNLDCTIGHNCVIDDFVTISPGCHLSGYTTIKQSAFLGSGAITIEHTEVGEFAIIGAGAVVVHNIPPGITAVGVPAKAKD